jgi:hypothetical protein
MRAIRRLISGLLTILLVLQPAYAFSLFKKKITELPDYINEEIYIDRLFQASDGVYKLNIAILIPKGMEILTVTITYDQLKQKKINNIAWIKGINSTGKFLSFLKRDKQKKPQFEKIYPFRKEEFRKEDYELEKDNPDIIYDRVSEQRFIVYKRYQFYQKEIFGKRVKKSDHLLEFQFEDGSSRAIRIRKELYHDERYTPDEKILPTFFGKGVKPDPRYAPNPVLPKEAHGEAKKEYNKYLKQQNEVIKSRNQEAQDKVMQHIENSYGTELVPEFDGMYRAK